MAGAGMTAAIFVGWALAVAWSDIVYRRVSNGLIVAGLGAALIAALTPWHPFGIQIDEVLIGALSGLIAFLPLYATRAMGAADVKVFATLGAWCGAPALMQVWIGATLLAFVHVLALLVLTRTPAFAVLRVGRAPTMKLGPYRGTPYAACCVAVAVAMLWLGPWAGLKP